MKSVRYLILTAELFLVLGYLFYAHRLYRTRFIMGHYFNSTRWQEMSNGFSQQPIPENAVILFGDSMTEKWLEVKYFPDTLINMGIAGDFTEGLIRRADNVTHGCPKKLFIMIGINDIIERVPQSQIIKNYRDLVERIQKECKDTRIFIQSILPTADMKGMLRDSKDINTIVQEVNEELKLLSHEFKIQYVELYPHFVNEENELKEAYNGDGIHLSKAGYEKWETLLLKYK